MIPRVEPEGRLFRIPVPIFRNMLQCPDSEVRNTLRRRWTPRIGGLASSRLKVSSINRWSRLFCEGVQRPLIAEVPRSRIRQAGNILQARSHKHASVIGDRSRVAGKPRKWRIDRGGTRVHIVRSLGGMALRKRCETGPLTDTDAALHIHIVPICVSLADALTGEATIEPGQARQSSSRAISITWHTTARCCSMSRGPHPRKVDGWTLPSQRKCRS